MKESIDSNWPDLSRRQANDAENGAKEMEQKRAVANAEEMRQTAIGALWEAAANWQGDLLTREDGVAFSGNALSVGHLRNLDSKNEGPTGAFYLGRKRVYFKKNFVEFLIRRLEV